VTCLGILTDDYCKFISRYKVIISHLTDTISPALPIIMLIYYSESLLPALGILADNCHKPASRYPVIMNHLAGMILPSLPCPSSNDDPFRLLVLQLFLDQTFVVTSCRLSLDSSCQILSDCGRSDWSDFTNSVVPYKP